MSKWLVFILYLLVILHSYTYFSETHHGPSIWDLRRSWKRTQDNKEQPEGQLNFFYQWLLLWSIFAMFRLSPARARVNWPNTTSLSEISSEKLPGLLLMRGEHKSCSESARRRDAWNSWRKGSDLTTWPRRRGRKCKLSCKPRERSQQLKFKLVEISINKSCRSYFWMQILS